MVICTGTVYFVDLQSRFVDSKAQLFQSNVTKQYSSIAAVTSGKEERTSDF